MKYFILPYFIHRNIFPIIACLHLKKSKRNVESFLEVQDQCNQTTTSRSQHLEISENKKTKRSSPSFQRNDKEEVSLLQSSKSELTERDVSIVCFVLEYTEKT